MDKTHFADALAAVWKLVSRANKYIDETEPWVLAKTTAKKAELSDVMTHLAKKPAGNRGAAPTGNAGRTKGDLPAAGLARRGHQLDRLGL